MNEDFESRLRADLQQLANGIETPATLSDTVQARVSQPRRPRPPLALAAVAAAVVVLVAVVGTLATRDGHNHRLAVTSGPGPTIAASSTTTPGPSVPAGPETTNGPAVAPAPTGTSTTAARAGATAPTRPPATTPNPSYTPTPPTSAPGDCGAADLTATTATDHPSYAIGQTVTITVTVRNISGHRCQIQQPYGQTFGSTIRIVKPGGTLVWAPGPHVFGVLLYPSPKAVDPGSSYLWTTVQWDQRGCTGACAAPGAGNPGEQGQVPAGSYQAEPNVDPPVPAAPANFRIGG